MRCLPGRGGGGRPARDGAATRACTRRRLAETSGGSSALARSQIHAHAESTPRAVAGPTGDAAHPPRLMPHCFIHNAFCRLNPFPEVGTRGMCVKQRCRGSCGRSWTREYGGPLASSGCCVAGVRRKSDRGSCAEMTSNEIESVRVVGWPPTRSGPDASSIISGYDVITRRAVPRCLRSIRRCSTCPPVVEDR